MTELESLCADLASGDETLAGAAAGRLPSYGPPALAALRKLLKSPDADVRWWAVRSLAGFDNLDDALDDLLAVLQDETPDVRQAAALALYGQTFPRALEPLARALGDQDSLTARLAANALVAFGKQATPSLLEILKNGSPGAKLEAVRALAEIKDPAPIPGLMKALETGSAVMQYWATLGLDNMGVGMVYLKPD